MLYFFNQSFKKSLCKNFTPLAPLHSSVHLPEIGICRRKREKADFFFFHVGVCPFLAFALGSMVHLHSGVLLECLSFWNSPQNQPLFNLLWGFLHTLGIILFLKTDFKKQLAKKHSRNRVLWGTHSNCGLFVKTARPWFYNPMGRRARAHMSSACLAV